MGLTIAIPESPREVFELFFSDDLMQLMVTESDNYVEEVMGSKKFAKWMKISIYIDELKALWESTSYQQSRITGRKLSACNTVQLLTGFIDNSTV